MVFQISSSRFGLLPSLVVPCPCMCSSYYNNLVFDQNPGNAFEFRQQHVVDQPSRKRLRRVPPLPQQVLLPAKYLVVVVVVDSHIQRIVLATEETTVTQQVSHRPVKCQSRLWSQRGTKVNGSHHGDNPLLRPTGIQIATKSYAALQAMAPTNIKTVHQTSLLHIESNLDRLGMLSPTHDQRSQQKTGKITLQPVLINKSKFLKATHFVQK